MRPFTRHRLWHPFGLVLALLSLLLLIPIFTVSADVPAFETPFTTSVVVMNPGTGAANGIELQYYADHNPAIVATPTGTPQPPATAFSLDLPAYASRSLTLDTLYHRAVRYRGSGILYAPKPLLTTLVQVPDYSNIAARPISNGPVSPFTTTVHLPTVLRGFFGMMSVIAVQNVESTPITATLYIYEEDGDLLSPTYTRTNIQPGTTAYFDLRTFSIAYGFIGSAKITGTGKIYVNATEYSFTTGYAYSYEAGIPAYNVYMPSAVCEQVGSDPEDLRTGSFVAVRNAGTEETIVTITYSNNDSESATLKPNAKVSFSNCTRFSTASNFLGSARIESSDAPIVALTKVFKYNEYQTAYSGITVGTREIGLPFVRWTTDHWGTDEYRARTYLAIQNMNTVALTGTIRVKYFDYTGTQVATDTLTVNNLLPNAKINTDPGQVVGTYTALKEFGYYPGQIYGGSAIVQGPSGSVLAVVARTARKVGQTQTSPPIPILTAEDYSGVPLPLSLGGDD